MRSLLVPHSMLTLLTSFASAVNAMAESEESVFKHKLERAGQQSSQNDSDVVMSQQMIEFFLQADDVSLDLLMDDDMEFYTESISDKPLAEESS